MAAPAVELCPVVSVCHWWGVSSGRSCVDVVTELPSEPTVACQVCRSSWNSSRERPDVGLRVRTTLSLRHRSSQAVSTNHFSLNIPISTGDEEGKKKAEVIYARDTDETGRMPGELDTARRSSPSKADLAELGECALCCDWIEETESLPTSSWVHSLLYASLLTLCCAGPYAILVLHGVASPMA